MATNFQASLQEGLDMLQLPVNERQLKQLSDYLELLCKWNKTYNLTAIRDPEQMLPLHLIDSLSIGKYLKGKTFLDVGSGPGLPGIPLAIMYPGKSFTLLDSNGKKARFLFHAITTLELENTQNVETRVEEYFPEVLFDGVLSRAFSSLSLMLQRCHHVLSPQGHFFAMKGKFPKTELSELPKGYKVNAVTEVIVPGINGERHMVDLSFLEESK